MKILLLFLDGIGLGEDNPEVNPFARASLPNLKRLSNGKAWLNTTGRQESDRAIFVSTDPRLGVSGRPQSGTSQAAILTGINVPDRIGRHYGPKPDRETRQIIAEDNLFKRIRAAGKSAALLDAYPPRLLASIARGKTLPSSIQQAAMEAGQSLFTTEDVRENRALTAEWTGHEWHEHLRITDIPLLTPYEAGKQLVTLSQEYDFAMHSHWLTDYVGHRGPIEHGVELLERFDGVIQGLLDHWDDSAGIVIITSDHGNLEQIDNRHHTENDVPTVIIGDKKHSFAEKLQSLTDIAPAILSLIGIT